MSAQVRNVLHRHRDPEQRSGVTFNIANVGALLDLARSLGVANQDGYSALDEEKFAKVTQANNPSFP